MKYRRVYICEELYNLIMKQKTKKKRVSFRKKTYLITLKIKNAK